MKALFVKIRYRPALVAGFASLLALFVSIYFEFFLDKTPCRFCLYQRYGYVAILSYSTFGFLFPKRFSLSLVSLLFLAISLTGSYHYLIQIGYVKDPCHIPKITDINSFISSLENPLGCSRSKAKLLYIPAPLTSAIYSTFFCIAFTINYLKCFVETYRFLSKTAPKNLFL